MMDSSHILLLEQFIGLLKKNPEIIHDQNLKFFKDYLQSLGARIPAAPKSNDAETGKESFESFEQHTPSSPVVEEAESDVEQPELDLSCVIEEEEYESVEVPDAVDEVSEEMMDKSGEHRTAAMSALSDGNLEKALEEFTEAVKCNPNSAPVFAKRASVLCKMKRPTAALTDCDRALQINPDSAAALMWKGRANMLLGNFEQAQKDFSQSARIDSNETLEEWIRQNKSNADKSREYKVAVERKKNDRLIRAKKERMRKAKEENERRAKEEAERGASGMGGGMPDFGGFGAGTGFPPGAAGMGGGAGAGAGSGGGMPGMQEIFSDPDIMTAMQDPEVMNAFMDVQTNPANMSKYEDNPKVQKVLEALASKFGGGAGDDGGTEFPDCD